MTETSPYRYGTPNFEMLRRWLTLPPEDDGPFWALNLMKYRATADYGADAPPDARASGRDADDAYSPLGPLAAIGAMVAFHGEVVGQRLGEPRWDRIGIVRYPTRAAFFAMQQRDDFRRQHVHKEAGMEFTIVLSCLPEAVTADAATDGALVLLVERAGGAVSPVPGVTEVVTFGVEGVIVGDDRTFDRARFVRVAAEAALDALAAGADTGSQLVVVDPGVDRLVESVTSIPPARPAEP